MHTPFHLRNSVCIALLFYCLHPKSKPSKYISGSFFECCIPYTRAMEAHAFFTPEVILPAFDTFAHRCRLGQVIHREFPVL